MTLNIAHRGASRDAPENTLEAFGLAIEQGADMIETDLHLLPDGSVPLHHDSEIDGVPVGELTLGQLRQRIPSLPTLEEALDHFGSAIPFNLELKSSARAPYPGLPERVITCLAERDLLERTLFSCFWDPALARLRELEPAARVGLLVSPRSNIAVPERAGSLGAEAVHPELSLLTKDLVAELHAGGFRVNVYTVDDEGDQRRLIDWGVDGLFTNVPARLSKLLSS